MSALDNALQVLKLSVIPHPSIPSSFRPSLVPATTFWLLKHFRSRRPPHPLSIFPALSGFFGLPHQESSWVPRCLYVISRSHSRINSVGLERSRGAAETRSGGLLSLQQLVPSADLFFPTFNFKFLRPSISRTACGTSRTDLSLFLSRSHSWFVQRRWVSHRPTPTFQVLATGLASSLIILSHSARSTPPRSALKMRGAWLVLF